MDLSADGVVETSRLFPSIIRSDRRCNYDEVDAWLSGEADFPDERIEKAIRDFARIAATIGKRRVARGGLDFETVEAKVVLAEDGKPLHVVLRKRTVATNMIEEAMIRANEVVAEHMKRVEAPMIYRIHEDPDPEALDQIGVILKEFDYPIKAIHGASPATFQKIIDFAHTRPEKYLINSLLLRAMERARYVDYCAPHFGLASEAYTPLHLADPPLPGPDGPPPLAPPTRGDPRHRHPTPSRWRPSSNGSPSTPRTWSAKPRWPRTTRFDSRSAS